MYQDHFAAKCPDQGLGFPLISLIPCFSRVERIKQCIISESDVQVKSCKPFYRRRWCKLATILVEQGKKELSPPAGKIPEVLFFIWSAILPFDNILKIGDFGTVTKYLGLIVVMAVIADRVVTGHGYIIKPSSGSIVWGFFALLSVASLVWSASPGKSLNTLRTLVSLYGMYLVVSVTPWKEKSLDRLASYIIAGGVAASIISIYLFLSGEAYLTARASLVIGEQRLADPNHFGTSLILPFIFSLNKYFRERPRAFTLAECGVILTAIVLTGSRGAVAGVICAVLFLIWNEKRMKPRQLVLLATAVMVFLLFLDHIAPEQLLMRYTFDSILESQGSGRFGIWYFALEAFKKHPLIGWGYGTFSYLASGGISANVTLPPSIGAMPHNIYLQALTELGVLGFSLLLVALILHFHRALGFAKKNPFYRASTAALVGIAVSSFTLHTFGHKYFWLIQMLCALSLTSSQSTNLE